MPDYHACRMWDIVGFTSTSAFDHDVLIAALRVCGSNEVGKKDVVGCLKWMLPALLQSVVLVKSM